MNKSNASDSVNVLFNKDEAEQILQTDFKTKFKSKPTPNMSDLHNLIFNNLFTIVNSEGQVGYISTHKINNVKYHSNILYKDTRLELITSYKKISV